MSVWIKGKCKELWPEVYLANVEFIRPGHTGTLSDSQQDGLGVDEQRPAGETGQQEDENPSLQYHTHPLQIITAKRLDDTIQFR